MAIDEANRGGWVTQAGAAPDPRAVLDQRRRCEAELQQLQLQRGQQQQGQQQLQRSSDATYRLQLGEYHTGTDRHPHPTVMLVLADALPLLQGLAVVELGGGDRAANNAEWLCHHSSRLCSVAFYANVDMVRTSEQLGLPPPQLPLPPAASGRQQPPPAVTHVPLTYKEWAPEHGSMDAGVVINACDSAASAFIAAERLGRALRPGAPVVVAGSGSFQAGTATAVAAALEGQGFAVEACHPDLHGLEHCRPDHAFTVIPLRKPGALYSSNGGAAAAAPMQCATCTNGPVGTRLVPIADSRCVTGLVCHTMPPAAQTCCMPAARPEVAGAASRRCAL